MYQKVSVLIIEDEKSICDFMNKTLTAAGYKVATAATGKDGLAAITSLLPDVVLLDLGLPDMDGEEFIRITRRSSMIPIIVLSARMEEMDKVTALDLGANDYITKPFGTAELLARVRASLRINRMNLQAAVPNSVFKLDDLIIDYDRRQVTVSATVIHLTQTEFNILAYLSHHCGKVMTYSSIIRFIWGTMDDGSIKKLQVNMANIRKKLGCKPGENKYILNELGVGYRMQDVQM